MAKKRVTQTTRLKKKLNALRTYPEELFGQKEIQNLLLSRTKQRFTKSGTYEHSQKDPSGRKWKSIGDLAAKTRKKNKDRNQVLQDEGKLKESIKIVRDRLRAAVSSPTGAGFDIGVTSKNPRVQARALMHQKGGWTYLFGAKDYLYRIPQRKFLGISKQDTDAVEDLMLGMLKRKLSKYKLTKTRKLSRSIP